MKDKTGMIIFIGKQKKRKFRKLKTKAIHHRRVHQLNCWKSASMMWWFVDFCSLMDRLIVVHKSKVNVTERKSRSTCSKKLSVEKCTSVLFEFLSLSNCSTLSRVHLVKAKKNVHSRHWLDRCYSIVVRKLKILATEKMIRLSHWNLKKVAELEWRNRPMSWASAMDTVSMLDGPESNEKILEILFRIVQDSKKWFVEKVFLLELLVDRGTGFLGHKNMINFIKFLILNEFLLTMLLMMMNNSIEWSMKKTMEPWESERSSFFSFSMIQYEV